MKLLEIGKSQITLASHNDDDDDDDDDDDVNSCRQEMKQGDVVDSYRQDQ